MPDLRLRGHGAHLAPGIGEEVERPRRGDLRVELAKRAGGAVSRIGDRLQPLLLQALIEGAELGVGHVDLAAHLDDVGRLRRQLVRHTSDGAEIGGDVLAFVAVAARGGADQPALLVAERAGQAVDLRLGEDVDALLGGHPQEAPHPLEELDHVLLGEGVVERQHRHAVDDLGELRRGRRPDRDGDGALQLGEARLDREDAAAEPSYSASETIGASSWK